MRAIHIMCLAAVLAALLASCGGGGGRSGAITRPPQQPETLTPLPRVVPGYEYENELGRVAVVKVGTWVDMQTKQEQWGMAYWVKDADKIIRFEVGFDLVTLDGKVALRREMHKVYQPGEPEMGRLHIGWVEPWGDIPDEIVNATDGRINSAHIWHASITAEPLE